MAIAARAAEFPVMAAFELLMSHFEQLASKLLASSAAGSSPNVPPFPYPFPFLPLLALLMCLAFRISQQILEK